jgi:hypothetical protein
MLADGFSTLLILALSASTLALGGVYWALREQDRAMSKTELDLESSE